MKLQLLVPQYHEDEEVLRPLLASLALEQNVDFDEIGVIICSDGGEVLLSEGFLNSFPFRVEYYVLDHGGVSATRQACLDRATADYVMFCDADDMFYNVCGLWIVFREMEGDGFDTLSSIFIEETRTPEGQVVYVNREQDCTFVHGKIHRRQYLIDKKIRWNPALTIHEDSYFNFLCQNCLDDMNRGKYCQTPFYLWKWRDSSVCRRDPKYILKTFGNLIDSNTALITDLLIRGRKEAAEFLCCNMVYDAYYSLNKSEWINQENQEYRHKVEGKMKEYFSKFSGLFDGASDQTKTMTSMGVRNRMVSEGMPMESITFADWLKGIRG